MRTDDPAYRAMWDRSAAAAVDAITAKAAAFNDVDQAEAVERLALGLTASDATRDELAGVLAALAVHVVRAGS